MTFHSFPQYAISYHPGNQADVRRYTAKEGKVRHLQRGVGECVGGVVVGEATSLLGKQWQIAYF